jgi:hypothetical protein
MEFGESPFEIAKFIICSLQMSKRFVAFLSILSLFLSTLLNPGNAAYEALEQRLNSALND